MKKTSGFTLIELMIVVAIIAIIAAIAIPNLLRSRIQSNESAAIGNLRTITGSQVAYNSANGVYAATFDEMTTPTPPFLDGAWGTGPKSGYDFALDGDVQCFGANADPAIQDRSGVRHFFTDCSGVIRFDPAAAATNTSQPIGETAS